MMYPPNVAQTRLKLVKARFGISGGSWLCSGCSYILVFSFCLYFASFPAGGQVLDEILLGSLAHFLRLRGGNSESSTARKSLIVNLAGLAGKTGHTGRDHVRRSLRDGRVKLNIKVGVVKYSGGKCPNLKVKWALWQKKSFCIHLSI